MVTQRIDIQNSCRSILLIFREFNPCAVSLTVFYGEMHLFFCLLHPQSVRHGTRLGSDGAFLLEINTDRLTPTTQLDGNLGNFVHLYFRIFHIRSPSRVEVFLQPSIDRSSG